MSNRNRSMADLLDADIQEAVDAMLDAATMTRIRAVLTREQRREFLMQEAELEAQLLEHEGRADLADQLLRVANELRILQPKVVARGQGT